VRSSSPTPGYTAYGLSDPAQQLRKGRRSVESRQPNPERLLQRSHQDFFQAVEPKISAFRALTQQRRNGTYTQFSSLFQKPFKAVYLFGRRYANVEFSLRLGCRILAQQAYISSAFVGFYEFSFVPSAAAVGQAQTVAHSMAHDDQHMAAFVLI
jgi:hypothetical protein